MAGAAVSKIIATGLATLWSAARPCPQGAFCSRRSLPFLDGLLHFRSSSPVGGPGGGPSHIAITGAGGRRSGDDRDGRRDAVARHDRGKRGARVQAQEIFWLDHWSEGACEGRGIIWARPECHLRARLPEQCHPQGGGGPAG